MIDDNAPIGVMLIVMSVILFGMGFLAGWQTMDDGVLTEGRNEGIVFCTEKPKECKISYDYLKLQEKQK